MPEPQFTRKRTDEGCFDTRDYDTWYKANKNSVTAFEAEIRFAYSIYNEIISGMEQYHFIQKADIAKEQRKIRDLALLNLDRAINKFSRAESREGLLSLVNLANEIWSFTEDIRFKKSFNRAWDELDKSYKLREARQAE